MDGSCIVLLIGIALILLGVLGLFFTAPEGIRRTNTVMLIIGIALVVSPFIIDSIKEKKK